MKRILKWGLLGLVVAAVPLLLAGFGFAILIDRIEQGNKRQHDELAVSGSQIEDLNKQFAAARIEAQTARKTAQDRDREEQKRHDALKRELLDDSAAREKKIADAAARQSVQALADLNESKARHKALVDRLDAIELLRKTNAQAAETQLAALKKDIAEFRYPSLPAGEKQLLEVCFESVGHMAKTDHLALFVHWPDARVAPDKALQAKIKTLYIGTGTEVGDVFFLNALEDAPPRIHVQKPAEGSKYLSWYLGYRYVKRQEHVPIAFMSLEFYKDRVRVYWYRGPGRMTVSDAHRGELRRMLHDFAKDLGVNNVAATSDWGPVQPGGYSDLYLK